MTATPSPARGAGWILTVAALLLVAVPPESLDAGRGHFEKRARKKGWDYPKVTGYTYIEDGKAFGRLTLAANVELAMWHLRDDHLPVIFVLATEKGPKLQVAPDRFQLLMPDGRAIEPVPYPEMIDRGWKTEIIHDWGRLRTVDPTHGFFDIGYRRVPTRFYPDPTGTRASGIIIDEVDLYGDQYAMDFLYFPHPGEELAGRELRLRYTAPPPSKEKKSGKKRDKGEESEAEEPARVIEVTFVIPDPRAEKGPNRPHEPPQSRSASGR